LTRPHRASSVAALGVIVVDWGRLPVLLSAGPDILRFPVSLLRTM
jgi:hypothetical protein